MNKIAIPESGKPTVVPGPEGHSGAGFFATRLEDAIGLARKNSIWPLPFATSCCGIKRHFRRGWNNWPNSTVRLKASLPYPASSPALPKAALLTTSRCSSAATVSGRGKLLHGGT